MNKNHKKLLSWSETWKLNKRAYVLLYKRFSKMFLSRMLYIIWTALTPYVTIYLSAMIITELSSTRSQQRLTELVLITLLSTSLIAIVTALLSKWRNVQCADLYYKVQHIFTEKIMDMDFCDVDDTRVHQLYNTIEQNSNGGGWGFRNVYVNVENGISAMLTLSGGISLTISLFTIPVPSTAGYLTSLNNPLFILIIILLMFIIICIPPILSTKAESYYALFANSHNLGNRLFHYFGWLGHKTQYAADVRIYRQDLICDKYNTDKTNIFNSKGIFAKLGRGPIGFYKATSSAVSHMFTGVVYIFVCIKALAGAFGIGAVTQYIASITKLSEGISSLMGTAGDMRNNAPFLKLSFEFLDIPNKMYQGSLTIEKRSDENYEIEFKNVSFKYPGNNDYALRNVNMKFNIGEHLAVVGENGSGKTTFIKLLCRLYDPSEGEILLNGINIRKYSYLEYISIFSVVFQDFKLFAFSLGENVATKVLYDKNQAQLCLNKAGFKQRLNKMPKGLDTYLYQDFNKDGIDVSGGEAQKIAVARTLYKNSPFIILDEPTAALDPIAEAEIYSKFNEIVGRKTAIYISHRLSSCRFCDEILVFHHGKIVQQGSHEQLILDDHGKYHQLWHAQAQYYSETH